MQTKFIEQTRVQVATIPFFKAIKKKMFLDLLANTIMNRKIKELNSLRILGSS